MMQVSDNMATKDHQRTQPSPDNDFVETVLKEFEDILRSLDLKGCNPDATGVSDECDNDHKKLADLLEQERLQDSEYIRSTLVPLFERLAELRIGSLRGILTCAKAKHLTFVKAGNALAADNYQWLLSDILKNVKRFLSSEIDHEKKRAERLRDNLVAILSFLVKSLNVEISAPSFGSPTPAYLVTLLKASLDLDAEIQKEILMNILSKQLYKVKLQDLQTLEGSTVQNLFSRCSVSLANIETEIPADVRANVSTVIELLDGYLYSMVLRNPSFHLTALLNLLEAFPAKERLNCDKIYEAIDIFLWKNPGVTDEVRIHLSAYLDPFKLSVSKTEDAVQNPRMILQPNFFTTLYLAQKRRIKQLESLHDVAILLSGLSILLVAIMFLFLFFWMRNPVISNVAPMPCPTLEGIVAEVKRSLPSPPICPTADDLLHELDVSYIRSYCPSVEEVVAEVKRSLPPPPSLQELLIELAGTSWNQAQRDVGPHVKRFARDAGKTFRALQANAASLLRKWELEDEKK